MRMIGRRSAVSGLAAIGTAALMPRPSRAEIAGIEAAARKEGTLIWYVAQVDSEQAEALGRAFTAQYPEIRVSVIRTTGQVAYQRLLLDLKNNAPQCDVFSTTDISQMPALKQRNALAHYVPVNATGLLPEFKSLSDDGWYYVNSATNHFLIYNTDKVHAEDAPRSWNDLLDPKWKNQIALPHPAFRLRRRLGGGPAQDLWLELLRKTGKEQPTHRPFVRRSRHPVDRRRVPRRAWASQFRISRG
jgi:iron(III) transport system substrate-binding protein